MINLIVTEKSSVYQNIFKVKSEGVEAAAGWTSPAGLVDIDINATWIDLLNTATEGAFAKYSGDRIPNRPYLFTNASLRFNWMGVFTHIDELSATWNARFVEEYDLIWESLGKNNPDGLQNQVRSQVSHSLGFAYGRDISHYMLNLSAELQNLTDAKLYDFYGVQRPGRAFYVKVVLEF